MERREQSAKGALHFQRRLSRSVRIFRLDKTRFFAGQSLPQIATGELLSFFHLNPPKAGESCQACRFL